MERNRYVYSMSRFVVVVASAAREGGTWAGAVENMEAGWSPLVVRADEGAPAGNKALLAHGAIPLRSGDLEDHADLRALYRRAAEEQRGRGGDVEALELPLGTHSTDAPATAALPEGPPTSGPKEPSDLPPAARTAESVLESVHRAASERIAESSGGAAAVDVFALVLPHIEEVTASPRSLDELKDRFPGVLESQLKAWLSRAVEEGSVRRSGRPPRYTRR
jgi:predicted Rossmann fold nucleotide-binding protein DprA/Smf involved in DNA uptake